MNFISVEFLLFVLVGMLFYYIMPKKTRWIVLLILSYVFYYISSKKLMLFLLLSTITIYLGALIISKINSRKIDKSLEKEQIKILKSKKKRNKKLILLLVILINIGVLITLKYNNFFAGILNSVFNTDIAFKYFILPLGISYYTLQAISYIVDVYFGKYEASKNPFKVSLFLTFFPQMLEGPIGRFDKLADNLMEGHSFNYEKIKSALVLIGWGYLKKLVIADRAAILVNKVFAGNYTGSIVVTAIILYTVQIYTEFSGCMDIVRGVGELFGVELDKNFKQPFFSKSISEFWRRWHITLGTWLKDYIFYPISLSKMNLKLSRNARNWKFKYLGNFIIVAFPLFFVWFINGIWHGSSFKYIFYGLYYYILMMLGMLFKPLLDKIIKWLKININDFSYKLFQIARTSAIVVVGLTIFRADTLKQAIIMLKSIFKLEAHKRIVDMNLGLNGQDFNVLIIGLICVFVVSLILEKGINIREKIAKENTIFQWIIYFTIIFTVIIFGIYGIGYDASSFIYGGF